LQINHKEKYNLAPTAAQGQQSKTERTRLDQP
jgi:hypothetical protein